MKQGYVYAVSYFAISKILLFTKNRIKKYGINTEKGKLFRL